MPAATLARHAAMVGYERMFFFYTRAQWRAASIDTNLPSKLRIRSEVSGMLP